MDIPFESLSSGHFNFASLGQRNFDPPPRRYFNHLDTPTLHVLVDRATTGRFYAQYLAGANLNLASLILLGLSAVSP